MATPVAALIVRVAADLADLKTGVADIGGTLDGMSTFAARAGSALAAAFSIQQIAGAAKDVVNMTGHVADLATKAGISAEAVQELDFAAKQSGSSFDAVSGALAKMANGLLEEKGGVIDMVKKLGLNVNELRAMAPDMAFQRIAAAVAGIPDPMERSKAAMEIFGKSGAELLPVMTSDIAALRQEAKDAGLVLSNDLVAAGDAAGDAFDKMQTKIGALKAQAMLPMLELLTSMPESLQTVAGVALTVGPALSGIGTAIMLAGGPVVALAALKTAFTAILPFLGPVGLIAVGIAAIVLAFKNWDAIKETVYGVYFVIKTYMQDKLDAVWNWVVQKIEWIKNSFKSMYNAVVGNSYVPDMIQGIKQEFGKLDQVMVEPVMKATGQTTGSFAQMSGSTPSLGGMRGGGGGGITIQPGAVVINNPILNDRRTLDDFTNAIAGRLLSRVQMGGRTPVLV
jgi:hypothetical protein